MLNRRDLLWTVVIQGAGVVATLLISVVVAHRLGAGGQGLWAGFRAVIDLVAVIAAYGFPASFAYLVNVRRFSIHRLATFTFFYSLATLPLVGAALAGSWQIGLLQLQTPSSVLELGLLTVGAGLTVAYSMLRGLALPTVATWAFNTISVVLPACLVFMLLAWPLKVPADLMSAGVAGFGLALALSLGVWLGASRKELDQTYAQQGLPWRELVRLGGWNFAVAAMTAAMPAYTMQRLAAGGVDVDLIGCFSIAALALGALLTPANLAGPIVYNAWTRSTDAEARHRSYRTLLRWSLMLSVLTSVFAGIAAPHVLPALLGHEFSPAILPTWILLLAVPLGYVLRLMANVLLAGGHARAYAWATFVKLVVCVACIESAAPVSIDHAVICWVAAEVAALTACAVALRQRLGWSTRQSLGWSAKGVA